MHSNESTHSIDRLSNELLEILASKGYSDGTLANYRRTLARVKRFMGGNEYYSEQIGTDFFDSYSENLNVDSTQRGFIRTVIRRLDEVNAGSGYSYIKPKPVQSIPQSYCSLLEAYLQSCSRQGNKNATLKEKRRFCSEFINNLNDLGCADISLLNSSITCQAVLRISNKEAYAVISQFLRYLYKAGPTERDYSQIIPKYRRSKLLPPTYTIEEIRRLESAVDRSTKTGKRDYAALLLATRLGMRSGDIAGLCFENLDFKSSTINFVQNKTGQPLSLPMLPEIQEALSDYIQEARPQVNDNSIFHIINAPYTVITTSVLRHMLTGYFKAAGIEISDKKHGPHSLRSSLASSMINGNVPYESVRKLLGHSDPDAIKHYAKVDIENLRLCAIDVPAPTGSFVAALEGGIQ